MGIEPTSGAWKAPILPLNYARQMDFPFPKGRAGEAPGEGLPLLWGTPRADAPAQGRLPAQMSLKEKCLQAGIAIPAPVAGPIPVRQIDPSRT